MLDAGIYEQLSRLVIAMKQKSSQNMAGNRRSVQKGTSAEFSDFREYMPGDDLRRLDWNVYARSERMYIREYFEEKEAVVSVILDTSASMHYGKKSKAELAQDLCAVIAFLTLHIWTGWCCMTAARWELRLWFPGERMHCQKYLDGCRHAHFRGQRRILFPPCARCRGVGRELP